MRGESIFLRGFQADASDIYRDGVRESGQVRRSTANIERVEILKGPSSVLYGRTNGGGVINMVSKYANFKQSRNIGAVYGLWANRSLNMDINEVLNKNVAIRLTGEVGRANSFRSGIDSKTSWFAQYYRQTRQRLEVDGTIHLRQCGAHARPQPDQVRVRPLRTAFRMGFAHQNDFVKDKLQVWRSDLEYASTTNGAPNGSSPTARRRRISTIFMQVYAGSENGSRIKRNYAWQQTDNKTLSSSFTLNGDYHIGRFENHLTVGMDYSRAFSASIDPYDRASWPASGRLQPILTQNRHKADSYGIFVQNIFSATPDLKFVLGGRYDKYTFNSENNSPTAAASTAAIRSAPTSVQCGTSTQSTHFTPRITKASRLMADAAAI